MALTLKTFYATIIKDAETATAFLKNRGLLSMSFDVCPKVKNGVPCGGNLKQIKRNDRPYLRCTKRGCQAYHSTRKGNKFFSTTKSTGAAASNLPVDCILELVFMWVRRINATMAHDSTGRSNATVTTWYNLCREVCVWKFQKRGKTGGPGLIIQIDESLFQGKRKYNRGRLMTGDRQPHKRPRLMPELEVVEENEALSDDSENDKENDLPVLEIEYDIARNYGKRMQGPWVFGLICKNTKEVRLFTAQKRDAATLIPIIEGEIQPGSTIMSDQWRAYSSLRSRNFEHQTVNHSEFFIDRTQGLKPRQLSVFGGM